MSNTIYNIEWRLKIQCFNTRIKIKITKSK